MGLLIRQATSADARSWIELLHESAGKDYPDPQIYNPAWIATQLDPVSGHETWLAEAHGQLQASISFLQPASQTRNPVLNLGRQLFRRESFADGAAEALLAGVKAIGQERKQLLVARVPACDPGQQQLHEKLGYVCAGYQPYKHLLRLRQGTLFYICSFSADQSRGHTISEGLAEVHQLASAVLDRLGLAAPALVRDGLTGYPLVSELYTSGAAYHDFASWRLQAPSARPPTEMSSGYNLGLGLLRTPGDASLQAVLGRRDGRVVAGLAFLPDTTDRCVRLVDCFSTDDLSMGALLHHVVRQAREEFQAVYLETDILLSAPRLLKTAEQLGFVPVAYLPGVHLSPNGQTDVVKMVKLNLAHACENLPVTPQAEAVVQIVDQTFQKQRVGLAVINLLRGLSVFEGLGDGELRKMAAHFEQRLYRPGEKIFSNGDSGDEVYVVMRGKIDIHLADDSPPIASVGNGQVFGERAFLDGSPRVANAVANQATVLLVIQRSAFNDLIQREPQLGLTVMRNMARALSTRLRRTSVAADARR